jgi:hypothetical protein
MTEHDCLHEKDIGGITAILNKIKSDVYGNGQEGLVRTIPRLEEKINNLVTSVASHTTVISKFIEFQATHTGEEKTKKDMESKQLIASELKQTQRRDTWYRILTIIGLVIILFGLYLNNRKSNKIEKRVDDLGAPVVTRGNKIMDLPSDAQIRFFPNDFLKDTIKK